MIDNKEIERMATYLEAMSNSPGRLRDQLTAWSEDTKMEYKKLYEVVKSVNGMKVNKDTGVTTTTIGKPLEDLVQFIFEKSGLFKIASNVRTRTNEMDHVILLDYYGKMLKKFGAIDIKQDYFISECKNYKKRTGITYVGKFYTLLEHRSTKLGIMFSYHGLSTKNGGWGAAEGLAKQLYLKRNDGDKIYIIDFNKKHFEMLEDGNKSVIDIIENEMRKLHFDAYCFDVDYGKHDLIDVLNVEECLKNNIDE